MGLRYENLDAETRQLMLEEIDGDAAGSGFYISNYLTEQGAEQWPALLRAAAEAGNDDSLAQELQRARAFRSHTQRRKPKGGFTMAAVPVTAAQTLAESQFNMYYMRALARRGRGLQVYRAKEVANPRRESEEMIGSVLDPVVVLEALRATKGVEPPTGIPLPNTGITVRLTQN